MQISDRDTEATDVGSSMAAAAKETPTDPFRYLARHIQHRVAITLLPLNPADEHDSGAVVSGTLLSVDDLCNVLLRNWMCTDAVTPVGSLQQPRKKTRTEEGDEESMRLVRGAQIASISILT